MTETRYGPGLAAFGLSAAEEHLYRIVLRRSPVTPDVLGEAGEVPEEVLEAAVDRLVVAGLVHRVGGDVVAVPPERLLAALVDDGTARFRGTFERLEALSQVLPSLLADRAATTSSGQEYVVVETAPFEEVVPLLRELADTSTGDLRWFRPDQWRLQAGREIDDWVKQMAAEGRTSRVLYPARVLEEAPDVVRTRAEAGEHVRVLATLPARLAVFGSSAAVVHEHWRAGSGRLLVMRHPAMVEILTLLFELMWERAINVPGLEGPLPAKERWAARRLLLDELARGAKDEQIARSLGLSLRTVRRRVAEVMDELGVDSRFQAGVEAVRRGWV